MGAVRPVCRQFARLSGRRRRAWDRGGAGDQRFGIEDGFPDRTLVLALAEGGARARARDNELSDRIGGRPESYHQKVDLAFRQIANEEPERVRIIDASGSAGEGDAAPARCAMRTCCRDRRAGQGGRRICQRLEIAAAAPCLAAGRTEGRRQGDVRPGGGDAGARGGGGPAFDLPGLETPADHPMARLMAAGSHPDLRWLERLERQTGGLARNISVDQVARWATCSP